MAEIFCLGNTFKRWFLDQGYWKYEFDEWSRFSSKGKGNKIINKYQINNRIKLSTLNQT
jgi:hypothetical protein